MTTATPTESMIFLNGEPVITTWTVHMLNLGGWLYGQEEAASEDCDCRRCRLHNDFGGCIVAEVMWGLVLWMSDPVGTFSLRG